MHFQASGKKNIQFFVSFQLVVIFFAFCHSPKQTTGYTNNNPDKFQMAVDTIPYSIAQNYFVKNTVESIPNPKIESEETFKTYFGAAAKMGESGKPTVIDFAKEFAIAAVLPAENVATTIHPVSLKKGIDGSVVFEYKVETGNKLSYTIRPFLLLVVDKKFDGNLSFIRIN
jgi:hypothetical protein